ncbi:Basic-leucine zipper domain [Teratosphaeria destructans]|uniref:Basic-leucine zipper domain n=1 Tax=Teratosphaeria destructans TaxID=418781 RepID=A0A9W7STK4_9PEZI|nr:Basic-leucine zipper domain [Teratosphaeria destructans]
MAGDIQALDALAFGDLFAIPQQSQHQQQSQGTSLASLSHSPSLTLPSHGLSTPQYDAPVHSHPPSNQTPSISLAQSAAASSQSRSDRSSSQSPLLASEDKVQKRKRNTEAARRYRQRKVDRVTELEEALAAMQAERDELRLKLAKSETEAEVLRGMFREGQKECLPAT